MKLKSVSKKFANDEKAKQIRLLSSSIFEGARSGGYAMLPVGKNKELRPVYFPFILVPEDSIKNLYAPIRQEVLDYFERYDIAWWNQSVDHYFPTGQLLSSQNHCLNHLFAIRKDYDAVLAMINALSDRYKFECVLPSPLDKKEWCVVDSKKFEQPNYITFEFALANKTLLGERGNSRGAKCTSVDALIYAQSVDGKRILIPIEWKYTEAYKPLHRASQASINRYPPLIDDNSTLQEWLEMYEYDPYYEFARQELFMEQIIKRHPHTIDEALMADDYLHIIVCPQEHKELRDAIFDFKGTLRFPWKLECKSQQELLAPLKESNDSKLKALINYLEERYWN
ncbi:MAG: hypothetical protein MJZ53_00960 [Paludibacteraceae bacterium]|nr:hypothetical protein [Paludibacteraceae bacterium]